MGAVCCRESSLDFDSEIDLSHFALLRSVGKGAFGKVRVVQHKRTKQLFALKYINKERCIHMRAVENIISERRILERVNFGLIVNLRYAFQDDENLFMVLDLMLGGDLRFHLDRLGVMPESYVQFYAAQVALSLRYLHSRHIVHRDLKPDNILLNQEGHAHLTDFNIAVQFSDTKPLTSVAGSMAYMAPEVLAKRGYFATVDWWSLGVVCFELMTGKRPFRGKTNEALQQAILHDGVNFPDSAHLSNDAKDFIHGLLTRDINKRLGVGDKGFRRLMAHSWLKHIEWDRLDTKEAVPPFTPDSKRANFDPTHELEEILLEDNPLKVRKRAQPKRSANSNLNASFKSHASDVVFNENASPERQLMEERFLTFDYTKPEENERRKAEMEQARWTRKMAKTGGRGGRTNHTPARSTSRRVNNGTYHRSATEVISQKPATPLSASDILKLEELERMKRANQLHTNDSSQNVTTPAKRGQEWRPPSGILPASPTPANITINPAPLSSELSPISATSTSPTSGPSSAPKPYNGRHHASDSSTALSHQHQALLARDEFILKAGGTPPPAQPPSAHVYSPPMNSPHHANLHSPPKPQPSPYYNHSHRRQSSDSSYQMPPHSPDNVHLPLMTPSSTSISTRADSPLPPQKWMYDANTLPPIPSSAVPIALSSAPLPPPTSPPPPIPTSRAYS
ncbi:kinase-like protein [Hesseltinella vesiculosa]|uniref:Kinase-like protein n=1 Tax=Hesseltinella vesiculosa TaxID=101127 RepID=A0A1X2GU52_9FUNG|nr:kinase-like protein [Hesseltinella vesiculosa]